MTKETITKQDEPPVYGLKEYIPDDDGVAGEAPAEAPAETVKNLPPMHLIPPMRIPGYPGGIPPVALKDIPVNGKGGKKLRRLENIQQAMGLRKAGCTYEQIGAAIGVSTQNAFTMVRRGVELYARQIGEDARTIKACMIERLDGMTLVLWSRLHPPCDADGKYPELADETAFGVIDRLVKLDNLRARLDGLEYAPPAPSETPEGQAVYDARRRAKQELSSVMEGATLDEKRQLLEIISASRARREAKARGLPAPQNSNGETDDARPDLRE